MTPDTIVVRSAEPLSAPVSDTLVLFSLKREKYFALDAVSTAIWERLDQPIALKDLCESLGKEFDVDPAVCERDTLQLVAEWVSRGLVDVVAGQRPA